MKTYKEFSQEAQLNEAGPLAVLGLLGKGALMQAGAEALKGIAGLGKNIVKGTGKFAAKKLKGEGESERTGESTPTQEPGLPRAS
jgi:hypothetical protein